MGNLNLYMPGRALLLLIPLILIISGCREDEVVPMPQPEKTGEAQQIPLTGFWLLNQGNMGANKASLDLYTFADAMYMRNIYPALNPDVALDLGDVGNAMRSYGSKLYIVVNCSNKVEVLDLHTGRRIGRIEIPNCRDITFSGPNAYVTSYAGPVEVAEDYAQLGYVARIDTLTLRETGRRTVGYQPDGIAICEGRIFVANSGGYRVPNYERTVSILDLETLEPVKEVEVAENLCHALADRHGYVWISSRGDYYDIPSRLYRIDAKTMEVVQTFDFPVSAMWLSGDRLLTVSASFNYDTFLLDKVFTIIDTKEGTILTRNFVSDGTEQEIRVPYGVAENPETGEIYVTDARTYINPGYIYCYSPDGQLKWKQRTGDVPSSLVFF